MNRILSVRPMRRNTTAGLQILLQLQLQLLTIIQILTILIPIVVVVNNNINHHDGTITRQILSLSSILSLNTVSALTLTNTNTNTNVQPIGGLTQRLCQIDADCQKLHINSICQLSTKTCSNPYHQHGCLASRKWKQQSQQLSSSSSSTTTIPPALTSSTSNDYLSTIRVCSSDDKQEVIDMGYCQLPSSIVNYTEIRLVALNWESAMFTNWIVQIILSEILHVPTSIETGKPNVVADFYNPTNEFNFGIGSDWDAVRTANTIHDCRRLVQNRSQASQSNTSNTDTDSDTDTDTDADTDTNDNSAYKSCAHVSLETWEGQIYNTQKLLEEDVIEKPSALGVLGNTGWYIPRFTGTNDTTLFTYLGMQGEENRRKLAQTFLRPTKWIDYCTQVSTTNCTVPDTVAQRGPTNLIEESMMFLSEQYTGYFRATEENDCGTVDNPKNCTGHIVDYPCGWSTYLQQQTHHLNIALASSGDELVCRGYTYNQMLEIWQASNATKSNVIMVYWSPDRISEQYVGTHAEFLRVSLPRPTQSCHENRIDPTYRCDVNNSSTANIYGNSLGSCDYNTEILVKIVSNALKEITINDPTTPYAFQSPAYDLIHNFQLTSLQLGTIFEKWNKGTRILLNTNTNSTNGIFSNSNDTLFDIDNNTYNNEDSIVYQLDPREVVCEWVLDNIDLIYDMIPRTYPRRLADTSNNKNNIMKSHSLYYISIILASIGMIYVTVLTIVVFLLRKRRVFMVAQPVFVSLVLFGYVLVQIGSVMISIQPPTNATCIASNWFIYLGYTIELVSLLVKVGALNKLMTAAKQFRRLRINRNRLLINVALVTFIAIAYLCAWTIIDPPQVANEYLLLTTDDNNNIKNDNIIQQYTFCNSNDYRWGIIALGWRSILLLSVTVLAFQSRNNPANVNESKLLAIMIYFQFSFLIGNLLLMFLQGKITSSHITLYQSILHSIDVISGTVIYFLPKLVVTDSKWIEIVKEQNMGNLRKNNYFEGGSNVSSSLLANRGSGTTNPSQAFNSSSSNHDVSSSITGIFSSFRRSIDRNAITSNTTTGTTTPTSIHNSATRTLMDEPTIVGRRTRTRTTTPTTAVDSSTCTAVTKKNPLLSSVPEVSERSECEERRNAVFAVSLKDGQSTTTATTTSTTTKSQQQRPTRRQSLFHTVIQSFKADLVNVSLFDDSSGINYDDSSSSNINNNTITSCDNNNTLLSSSSPKTSPTSSTNNNSNNNNNNHHHKKKNNVKMISSIVSDFNKDERTGIYTCIVSYTNTKGELYQYFLTSEE